MSILKIEPFSGLSGDMFLGALADLADAHNELIELPSKLGLKNVEIKISNVEKNGIACRHTKIIDTNNYDSPIPNKIFAPQKEHNHVTLHHNHTDSKITIQHKHHHHHRHLNDIYKLIDGGAIPDKAKKTAKDIFILLGQAEAKVHGVDINKIHFHEVGAVDSILDIVGTAYLLDKLDIQKTYSFDVCTGYGFVSTEHGRLPVPCPATKELLLGFPTYPGNTENEMTTPTGAAIFRYLNPDFTIPALIEEKTGYGPGEKEFSHPNVLRLSLCNTRTENQDNIYMIEMNIDDMSPEILGTDFQFELLDNGALDFYFNQVIMKKGRPGLVVSIIAELKNINRLSDFLLENTSSIGLRYFPVQRKILPREKKVVKVSLGSIEVKEVTLPSGKKRLFPEYESCISIARRKKLSIKDVFNMVNTELNKNI